MTVEPTDRLDGISSLSEDLFGDPNEVDSREAQELLRAGGIEPNELKSALYQRMLERAETYSDKGEKVPSLLKQALEDLDPRAAEPENESDIAQTSRDAVSRLLAQIKELPALLAGHSLPVFTAAYRTKKGLSDRDQKLLDEVAENLRKGADGKRT